MKNKSKLMYFIPIVIIVGIIGGEFFFKNKINNSIELMMIKKSLSEMPEIAARVGEFNDIVLKRNLTQFYIESNGKSGRFHISIDGVSKSEEYLVWWVSNANDDQVHIQKIDLLNGLERISFWRSSGSQKGSNAKHKD